jgi:hypothetical protein
MEHSFSRWGKDQAAQYHRPDNVQPEIAFVGSDADLKFESVS